MHRREDNSVGISFPQNASQNRCSNLLGHFVAFKMQQQSFSTSRDDFH